MASYLKSCHICSALMRRMEPFAPDDILCDKCKEADKEATKEEAPKRGRVSVKEEING